LHRLVADITDAATRTTVEVPGVAAPIRSNSPAVRRLDATVPPMVRRLEPHRTVTLPRSGACYARHLDGGDHLVRIGDVGAHVTATDLPATRLPSFVGVEAKTRPACRLSSSPSPHRARNTARDQHARATDPSGRLLAVIRSK